MAQKNGFKSTSVVTKRMAKNNTIDGFHISTWSDLSEQVQNTWLENNTLPEIPSNATCIRVHRLDPVSGKVLKTYNSMDEVKIKFKLGSAKLRSTVAGGLVHQGFKWAYDM